jgi:hypothetical protein
MFSKSMKEATLIKEMLENKTLAFENPNKSVKE